MSTLFLLDTDTISYSVREPTGPIAQQIQRYRHDVATSSVVASELLFGIARRRLNASSQRQERIGPRIERLLSRLDIRSYDWDAATHYADIRTLLEQDGAPIGAMDTLIAAHARSLKATLVTNNLTHFQRVPKLRVVSWA